MLSTSGNIRRLQLSDVCFTANTGRAHFRHRLALVAESAEEAIGLLASFLAGQTAERLLCGRNVEHSPAEAVVGLARAYLRGEKADLSKLDYGPDPHRLALPTYPFQRQRYWIEAESSPPSGISHADRRSPESLHPLLGRRLPSPLPQKQFAVAIRTSDPDFLLDHRIGGQILMPAAGYVEMVLAAGKAVAGQAFGFVEELVLHEPMVLREPDDTSVQLILTDDDTGGFRFEVLSLPPMEPAGDGAWICHASGRLRPAGQADSQDVRVSVEALLGQFSDNLSGQEYYRRLAAMGLCFGPKFQGIERLWPGRDRSVARIRLPETLASRAEPYVVHPVLLDACWQVAGSMIGDEVPAGNGTYVAAGIESFRLYQPMQGSLYSVATRRVKEGEKSGALTVDVTVFAEDGRIVAETRGLSLQYTSLPQAGAQPEAGINDLLYEVRWDNPSHEGVNAATRPEDLRETRWLVFSDGLGVGGALAEQLRAAGAWCGQVYPGASFGLTQADTWQVDPARPEDLQRLLAEARAQDLHGIVHAWSLDSPSVADDDAAGPGGVWAAGLRELPFAGAGAG